MPGLAQVPGYLLLHHFRHYSDPCLHHPRLHCAALVASDHHGWNNRPHSGKPLAPLKAVVLLFQFDGKVPLPHEWSFMLFFVV